MMYWHRRSIALTRRRALALGVAAGGLTLLPRFAAAQTHVEISGGNFQPLPIAIPKFIAGAQGDDMVSDEEIDKLIDEQIVNEEEKAVEGSLEEKTKGILDRLEKEKGSD